MNKKIQALDSAIMLAVALLWSCKSLDEAPIIAMKACAVKLAEKGHLALGAGTLPNPPSSRLPAWIRGPLAARSSPAVDWNGRAVRGCLIPRPLIGQVILRVLFLTGGVASKQLMDRVVLEVLGPHFTSLDLEEVPSGGVRWEIGVRGAREDLVVQGLVAYGTPYGKWQITEAGRTEALRQISAASSRP